MLLHAKRAMEILKKYRIPIPPQQLCRNASDALKFAKKTGFPLVIKIDSPDAVHKTEGGFVKIGIISESQLHEEFSRMEGKARKKRMKLNGILVQRHVSGIECIIGMKTDEVFGKVVMFGLGGIYAEVMKDVSFRVAPLEREDAKNMIKELKNFEIFSARGRKCNLRAVEDVILAVSKISENEKKIKELDINPLFVSEKTFAADVKFLL